jgi:hypothetical protein
MTKKAHFSRFSVCQSILAWTLPEPHISTSENLHAKQKGFFSTCLRGFFEIFAQKSNFTDLVKNAKKCGTLEFQISGTGISFSGSVAVFFSFDFGVYASGLGIVGLVYVFG